MTADIPFGRGEDLPHDIDTKVAGSQEGGSTV